MDRLLVLLLFVACLGQCIRGTIVINDEAHLATYLAEHYRHMNPDFTTRPVVNFNDTIEVDISLYLREVSYDEATGQARFSLVEFLEWRDNIYLAWHPQDFANIQTLHMPANLVWRPDIRLINRVSCGPDVDTDINVMVTADGSVKYALPSTRTVTCLDDPLDKDTVYCELRYGSWSFPTTKLNLQTAQGELDLSEDQTTGDWAVHSSDVIRAYKQYECCPEAYASVTYYVQLKRQRRQTPNSAN